MKLLILIILLPISVTAQIRPLADTELFNKRLSEAATNLQSIESDFTQLKYLDVFDETITSSGQFFYKKENTIRMDYNKPLDYLMVINGSRIKIVSEGKTNIMNLNANKMMNQMQNMLTACMVGDLTRLSSDYELIYLEDDKNYLVKITPVNRDIRTYIAAIEIEINKQDMSVNKLRLSETETDYTEYLFTNKRFNGLADETIFDIH